MKDEMTMSLAERILTSSVFEAFAGLLIIISLALIAVETDVRSELRVQGGSDSVSMRLKTLLVLNQIVLCFFTIECVTRMAVYKAKFFRSWWNINDLLIVVTGLTCEVISWFCDASGSMLNNTALLRSVRMVRLFRLTRILVAFPELYGLICGLSNCFRTLMWASSFIFMTLTVFSIIAVEYLHPLIPALEEDGLYSGCEWCSEAFSSVMFANLTFFQFISGDGWSAVARPIIERHPWTVGIFVTVIVTVVYGLLNLVIAAIVDTAAQAREADIETQARNRYMNRGLCWTAFKNLCESMDVGDTSSITYEDVQSELSCNPELQSYFHVMGVEDEDLQIMFELIGERSRGELTYTQFHEYLYKMRTLETKTSLFYVIRYVQHISETMRQQGKILDKVREEICCKDPNNVMRATSRQVTAFEEHSCPADTDQSIRNSRWSQNSSDNKNGSNAAKAVAVSTSVVEDPYGTKDDDPVLNNPVLDALSGKTTTLTDSLISELSRAVADAESLTHGVEEGGIIAGHVTSALADSSAERGLPANVANLQYGIVLDERMELERPTSAGKELFATMSTSLSGAGEVGSVAHSVEPLRRGRDLDEQHCRGEGFKIRADDVEIRRPMMRDEFTSPLPAHRSRTSQSGRPSCSMFGGMWLGASTCRNSLVIGAADTHEGNFLGRTEGHPAHGAGASPDFFRLSSDREVTL